MDPPGDFLLLGVGLLGLALLPAIWRALGDDPGARNALVVGVGLAMVAVGLDSIDPSTWTIAAERVQQTAEEMIELASGVAFVATAWLRLFSVLDTALVAAGSDAIRTEHLVE